MNPELVNAIAQIIVATIIGLAGWYFGDQRSKKVKTEIDSANTKGDDNAANIGKLLEDVKQLRHDLAEREEEIDTLHETVDRITKEREQRADELLLERRRSEQLEARIKSLEDENLAHRIEIVQLKAELNAYKSIIAPFFERLTLVVRPPELEGTIPAAPPPKTDADEKAA